MVKLANPRNTLLLEASWEVLNPVGGIHTVIRSKAAVASKKWGENYYLLGPNIHPEVQVEWEPLSDLSGPVGGAIKKMRTMGYGVELGTWQIAGRPKAILFDLEPGMARLGEIKSALWNDHRIPCGNISEPLVEQVLAFGYLLTIFLRLLSEINGGKKQLIAHFHEWMVGTPIANLRKAGLPVQTVFTTHATILGRYLAMNDNEFYEHLPFYKWSQEARRFNIECQAHIERAAAHGAHVLTTVSEVTGNECHHLLGRKPDVILPNGLDIERFSVLYELQNLHRINRDKIHEFVIGHFFPTYSFDLENTLYFFTSGRYEYRNKGFDLTLQALARLNWKMKLEKIDTTVVMFFITHRPFHSLNPKVLQSRAMLDKLRQTVEIIQKQVGEKLFFQLATSGNFQLPKLDDFVSEYWKLALKKTLRSWKSDELPLILTHILENDSTDEILNFLRHGNLINQKEDRVKIVYHPDFISPRCPLGHQDYEQFVRGCHMGIFPSYYEPWGYTPLECIACGVPTVTSDLSGFGDYALKHMPGAERKGVYVVRRRDQSYEVQAEQLACWLFDFVRFSRRERMKQRNRLENASQDFDWSNLYQYYERAYHLAKGP
jgi:glycogen synthase